MGGNNNVVISRMILRELRRNCFRLFNRNKTNKEVMYCLLCDHMEFYYNLPEEMRNNIELCMALVSYNPYHYEKLTTTMKTDAFVAMAFANNADAYAYNLLDEKFKNNSSFNREALLNNFRIFTALPEDIRKNRELLLDLFVQEFKYTINSEFFDISLSDDRDVVLGWITHFGGLIVDKISDRLKQDRSVALELVRYNGNNITKVDSKFIYDKEILIEALKNNPYAYNLLPEEHELKYDEDVLSMVLNDSYYEVRGISKVRKEDHK
jgi:hypothetical protein